MPVSSRPHLFAAAVLLVATTTATAAAQQPFAGVSAPISTAAPASPVHGAPHDRVMPMPFGRLGAPLPERQALPLAPVRREPLRPDKRTMRAMPKPFGG